MLNALYRLSENGRKLEVLNKLVNVKAVRETRETAWTRHKIAVARQAVLNEIARAEADLDPLAAVRAREYSPV